MLAMVVNDNAGVSVPAVPLSPSRACSLLQGSSHFLEA
jgi:hypothetical protein